MEILNFILIAYGMTFMIVHGKIFEDIRPKKDYSKKWKPIEQGCEKPFDIVMFKMRGLPVHVGIVVGDDMMIHCSNGSGTTISNYKRDQQWFRRIEGFYRWEK